MVYISIPYVAENDLIDRDRFIEELKIIEISDEAKSEAFDAVYNRLPRGLHFEISETEEMRSFLQVLLRLGIGYRISADSEYPPDEARFH